MTNDQNDHKIKSGSPLTHVRERNKKYDGCYLRHYAQGFFCFFFILIFFGFCGVIAVMIAQYYGK